MADFDWNDLRAFLAVARTGRLTVAARRLGADHTTIARRISALEAALQAKLFDRRPTGYTLTIQGDRLLRSAEAIESLALAARGEIGGDALAVSGAVRIGAPDGFGSCFLAPRIGALCRRHPDLDVQLVAVPRVFSLSKREADIAIGLAPPREGRLLTRKLTDYRLALYAAPAYLAAAPPISSPDDLRGHRFIGYIDDLIHTPELDYLPQVVEGVTPQITSTNVIAQFNATVAGAGLCILPCFIAEHHAGLVPVLPGQVSLTRSFWLITHADQRNLARIRAAADFISAEARAAHDLFLPPPRINDPVSP